jgi:hypothetical protein
MTIKQSGSSERRRAVVRRRNRWPSHDDASLGCKEKAVSNHMHYSSRNSKKFDFLLAVQASVAPQVVWHQRLVKDMQPVKVAASGSGLSHEFEYAKKSFGSK